MSGRRHASVILVGLTLVVALATGVYKGQGTAQEQSVPKDLKPLLRPRQSEMRLVTTRYNADRNLLATNYAGAASGLGGGGGRGGRGGPATNVTPPMTISPNRIARIKRFDLSWQAALNRLDNPRLSNDARTELNNLKTTVQKNLAELDTEAEALAKVMPLVPFSTELIGLI